MPRPMSRRSTHTERHILDVSEYVTVIAYPALDIGVLINLRRVGRESMSTEVRLSDLERELQKRAKARTR
jgi:hypothetical protein